MKRALIVVDVQNDFLPGGPLGVPDGDAILAFIVHCMRAKHQYEVVVITQDYHPPGHGSFASSHDGAAPFEVGELCGRAQMLWPDHCVQGSDGARLAVEIEEALLEIDEAKRLVHMVKKGQDPQVDSYSAFFDNARLHDTGLGNTLKEDGVAQVDVVGLALDYCVKATALDAASAGFATRVLLQGTRAVDPSSEVQVIADLKAAGVVVVSDGF